MSRTSGLTRRLGVAVSALGLVALATAPAVALTPAKDSVDCIDYGDVVKAPKGSIPRDDLHIVKKDVWPRPPRAPAAACPPPRSPRQ